MSRFLIEIKHSDDAEGCVRSLEAIVNQGSHLVTNAEFGCEDGVHSGWLIVDVESREAACQIVPPPFREDSRVVELRTWTKDEIREMVAKFDQ
jgi:hypothetical protein